MQPVIAGYRCTILPVSVVKDARIPALIKPDKKDGEKKTRQAGFAVIIPPHR